MPANCIVVGCNSTFRHKGISLHKIPKGSSKRWMEILGRPVECANKTVVCSNHFEEVCFDRSGSYVRLLKGAIPTRNLPKITIISIDSEELSEVPSNHQLPVAPLIKIDMNKISVSSKTKLSLDSLETKQIIPSTHQLPVVPHNIDVNKISLSSKTKLSLDSLETTKQIIPSTRNIDVNKMPLSSEAKLSLKTKQKLISFIKSIHSYSTSPTKMKEQIVKLTVKNQNYRQELYNANRSILKLKMKISTQLQVKTKFETETNRAVQANAKASDKMGKTIAAEMNKLRNIQMGLEKHDDTFFSLLNQEINAVMLLHKQEEERNMEIKYIQDHVVNTFNMLNSIKDKIVNYNAADLKVLRRDMEEVQQNIKTFKAEMKKQLTNLQEKEINLYESVKICNDQITEWSKPLNISFNIETKITVVKHEQKPKIIHNLIYDELCGWSREEHNVFLKMKKIHTDLNAFTQILKDMLFDKTEEDIIKHNNNYIKHLEFKKKQKEEIDKWREQRKRSKTIYTDKAINSPRKTDIKSPEDNKDRLLAWKEEKKLKTIKERQSELEQECKKKLHESTRRMKNEITKKEVEIWKLEKLADDIVEKEKKKRMEEKEKEFRTLRANQLIKEYQHQDEAFIKKMRENKMTKNKEIKKLKSRVVAEKDPSRLLKPTKQWLARINDNNKIEMCMQDIKIVPKLGIPQWRKEAI